MCIVVVVVVLFLFANGWCHCSTQRTFYSGFIADGTPATGLNVVVCACVLNVFLIILFVSYCIASGMCVSCFGTEHYFVWCKIM